MRVTETDETAPVPPVTVKGWVKLNWLPNGTAALLEYQVENMLAAEMVTLVVCRLTPLAGVNVNTACVMLREVAKPITVTVKPVLFAVAVTEVITGATELILTVEVGGGVGVMSCVPASSCAVMVAVPATVPVCTPTVVGAVVEPAGIVNVTVRPPVENCTVGSSGPEVAVNVSVRITVTFTGNGVPIPTVTVDWLAGVVVGGRPVRFRVGAVGNATVNWNEWLAVVPVLSFTVTVTVAVPVVVAVPVIAPPDEIESPEGSPVALQV